MLAFGKHYICILHTKWKDLVNWLVTWLAKPFRSLCVRPDFDVLCVLFFTSFVTSLDCCAAFFRLFSAEWAYCLLYLILVAQKNLSLTHSTTDSLLLSIDLMLCVPHTFRVTECAPFFSLSLHSVSFSAILYYYSHIRSVDIFAPNWNSIISSVGERMRKERDRILNTLEDNHNKPTNKYK